MSNFSITGNGRDWANFIHAASIQGNIKHLCIDVIGNVIQSSAEIEEGRHIWALTQSWLFDNKGQGSVVMKVDQAIKALKLLTPSKIWTAVESEGDLVFTSQEGDNVTMELLDYADHTDPNNAKSSYVVPKAEVENQRWITRLLMDQGLPIPVPAYREKRDPFEPYDQRIIIERSEWIAQLKAAKDIDCDVVSLETKAQDSVLTFYLEAGKQIGKQTGKAKLSGRARVPVESINGTIVWNNNFDRTHLEAVSAIANGDKMYLAMSSHQNQNCLWLGNHIQGDRKPSEKDPAITMVCYYIGQIIK